MTPALDGPRFAYALHPLPPGRAGMRRWRWELWRGERMLAAGWRLTQEHAQRAICAAASRRGHAQLGLHPLRPEPAVPPPALAAAGTLALDCGTFVCRLEPRLPGAAGWTPVAA